VVIKRAGLKALIWSSSSQFAQVAAGLIVLPFMVKSLPTEKIGLWYIFFAFHYLYQLLDLGFSPTYIRKLNHQLANFVSHTPEMSSDLSQIIQIAKSYYRSLSTLLGSGIFIIGSVYIYFSFKEQLELLDWITWVSFYLALASNFYYNYQAIVLQGFGKVEEVGFAQTISRFVSIFVSILFLYFGMGLLSLGLGHLLGVLAQRYLLTKSSAHLLKQFSINLTTAPYIPLKQLIDQDALKLGISSISSFMINRSGSFFVASFVGLSANASFSITLQIFQLISSLSCIPFQTNLPFFNFQRKKDDHKKLYSFFYRCLSICLGLFLAGSLVFVVFGKELLSLFKIHSIILPGPQLWILLFISGLEMNHTLHATFITTKGIVPFAKAAALSAVSILISSFFFVQWWGVLGILLARGLVQLSYNNWKWPLDVFQDKLRETR
jgi:O-antigen/teichoic acid export membrane protein